MVFIEAAACGKPSLAGEAGGTGSAVLHEETGLRVDGSDVDSVARTLDKLLRHTAETLAMGQRGWARTQSEFAWERVAEKTRALTSR